MKTIKYLIPLFIIVTCLSCGKEKPDYEPQILMNNWGNAIKNISYSAFCDTELYPVESAVFEEMYKNYYPDNFKVLEMEKPNYKKTKKLPDNREYVSRRISFSADIFYRNSSRRGVLNGDAELVRIISDKKPVTGWLIYNRTLVQK